MVDAVQVTVTFTRDLLVNNLPRTFTASLTFQYDDYVAMKDEDIEAMKLAKVNAYVDAEQYNKLSSAELERERLRIAAKIDALQTAKEISITADDEIARLTQSLDALGTAPSINDREAV